MTPAKNLGIWMDHASAHITELTTPFVTTVIQSDFTHQSKGETMSKSENIMHNKEQHQNASYYKKIGAVIKGYDEVVLFGPTTAKSELANLLKDDHHFEKTNVVVKHADKMSTHEEHTFIAEHYSR
ncbi:MAG TPA: hypothetical protein VK154_14035 [Chitinophagales bacterium]|nr:hypothetical protein [Chitinophagales bacterium]